MKISRGDFVSVVASGDFGKPRPALVIQSDTYNDTHHSITISLVTSNLVVQSDTYNDTHHSITICLVTSTLVDAPLFRVPIKPLKRNGLKALSQVMVDKVQTARLDRIKSVIGAASAAEMRAVEVALRGWLSLG